MRYHMVRRLITVGFGGNSTPLEMALSSTPIAIQAAPSDRSPRIRTFTLLNRVPFGKFNRVNFCYMVRQAHHVLTLSKDTTAAFTLSLEPGALVCCATLPGDWALYAISVPRIMSGAGLAHSVALGLPSDPASRRCPCLGLVFWLIYSTY